VRVASDDPSQAAALDLIAALLARGDEARLKRELIDNRQVATAVHGLTFRARDRALMQLVLTPAAQRAEAAAQALLEETLRLAREEVPADELARARALLLADLARGEEGADGHARRLGWERAVLGRDGAAERYRSRLEKLDPAGLRAAAAKLLRPDGMAVAVIEPARLRPTLDAESGRLRRRAIWCASPRRRAFESWCCAIGARPRWPSRRRGPAAGARRRPPRTGRRRSSPRCSTAGPAPGRPRRSPPTCAAWAPRWRASPTAITWGCA